MQRESWDRWFDALKERRRFRMNFICEHDMTEVRYGPGGNGYLIEDLPTWIKGCMPLLQVTLMLPLCRVCYRQVKVLVLSSCTKVCNPDTIAPRVVLDTVLKE